MRKRNVESENGFESWGGYMNAKKSKLIQQFNEDKVKCLEKGDDLFKGVAIFVNGYTVPSTEELRILMMKHGGTLHNYFKSGSTTHIIASNLPDSKLKLIQSYKIVKPSWITESISAGKLLNYCDYLLYTNQSTSQPSIKNTFLFQDENNKKLLTKTAAHEGFLNEFYNNSRLHHISTMGTIFKDYVNDIRHNKNHELSGKDELIKNYNKLQNNSISMVLSKKNNFIMHIDMDCFFVSVGLRDKPEFRGKPVAVTHSSGNSSKFREGANVEYEMMVYRKKLQNSEVSNKQNNQLTKEQLSDISEFDSLSEIASCSYEARKAGIKNGMFVGQALKLCPDLKFIHYEFESYKEVSFTLYNTVARYTLNIEAVSCDELYADCTEILTSTSLTPMEFATILRNEIKQKTGCPCSIGFGGNRLQARLATKKAKPDGQFYLEEDEVLSFMYSLPVSDLPGVGGSTNFKLKSLGIKTCKDLQNISLTRLQEELGKKLGETLHKYSFGKDDKLLSYNHVRKSVSADVNYGIRFQNDGERDSFLKHLSEEVANRLTSIKMKGRGVTLKLMVRSKDAPEEAAKYLGHGVCDQISKGTTLSTAVSASQVIFREVIKLINSINISCKELRGIGIQITRLESDIPSNNKLLEFLTHKKKVENLDQFNVEKTTNNKKSFPKTTYEELSISQIDQSVLNAMPADIQKEILCNIIKNNKNISPKPDAIESTNESVNCKDREQLTSDENKTYISPSELVILIKQWVQTEEHPNNRDISMVTEYLRHLIVASHLDDLTVILKYFFRFIYRNERSINWKQAYMSIVENCQSLIGEKYCSKLVIEDTFPSF